MSKTKKSYKSSDSETETSDESSSSSSESTEEQEEKREKKKRKQKDKKKKKKHKKVKSAKKNSKHKSGSEDEDSSDSSDSSESSEDEGKAAKKKIKKELERSPVRVKKERSRSRERDQHGSKSKWESPPRRVRSRSREKYRNDRSRSRERHRSRSRNRDRSPDYKRERNSERYRGDVKREREDRRDHRDRDRDQGGSYDRRERSPRRDRDRSRERNRERDHVKREPRSPNRSRGSGNRFKNQRKEDDGNSYEWGKPSDKKDPKESEPEPKEKEKPNFALSGALTEDANKVNGVVVKYAEPPEARKPKRRWRLYPFKGETALPVLHIHRQSCFLVGRDRKVVDLAVDHPSCSKQHAALQYRLVPFEREDGTQGKRVRLYLIDLDSANGTFLNNKRIDARKYYELMEKDVIKFGFSTREYVLLHENSKEDQEDDDIEVKEEPMDN